MNGDRSDGGFRTAAADLRQPFSDPANVALYVDGTPAKVPGFADLHRMALLLLAESAGQGATILVVGAGGGLELRSFAVARPDWRFTGIDPSPEMIGLGCEVLGPLSERVAWRQCYTDDAPPGLFDGATCLLTLHFLLREERLHTLREIARRLKPGARLVVAHHSLPAGADLDRWLMRSVAFADRSAADPAKLFASAAAMAERLPILSVDDDEELLREAGFADVELFYAGLTFRGWVASATGQPMADDER